MSAIPLGDGRLSARHLLRLLAAACLLSSIAAPLVASLQNGLARLPPMGWSTWNTFRCDYTEADLRGVARTLVSSGMAAAGYTSLNIDDCWEAGERTADGQLAYNATKFPSGLKAFGDYVHSLNLSFGLYTSSGPYTCQGYPGSWQHEVDDAKQFAAWGVDYLKLDCCYQFNTSDRRVAFEAMSGALLHSGRPILFSCDSDELILHENNQEYPAQWAPDVCNIARINWDIWDSWTSTMEILTAATNVNHASGPGYWNDLDILTVGMGDQTVDEYIAHFQLWCVASSPLIAGNDVRAMSDQVRDILTHKAAIAINQDRLAVAGNMIRRSIDGSYEVWAKPLWTDGNQTQPHRAESFTDPAHRHSAASTQRCVQPMPLRADRYDSPSIARPATLSGRPQPDFRPLPLHAVVLLNRLSVAQDVLVDFTDLFDNKLNPYIDRPPFVALVSDVWTGQQLGAFTSNFTARAVRGHASRMIAVSLLPASDDAEGGHH